MHPKNIEQDAARIVQVHYIGYDNALRSRNIIPHSLEFSRIVTDLSIQWVIVATDVDTNTVVRIALKQVRSWTPRI